MVQQPCPSCWLKYQHSQCLGVFWFTISTWKETEDRNVHHLCFKLLTENLFMCHISKKFFPCRFMVQQQQCNMSWINYCSWWDIALWMWCRSMAVVFTVEVRTVLKLKKGTTYIWNWMWGPYFFFNCQGLVPYEFFAGGQKVNQKIYLTI